MKALIKRCSICPSVLNFTNVVVEALKRDLDIEAEVEDGDEGIFLVFVDGSLVIQRDGDTLPDIEEVETAIEIESSTVSA